MKEFNAGPITGSLNEKQKLRTINLREKPIIEYSILRKLIRIYRGTKDSSDLINSTFLKNIIQMAMATYKFTFLWQHHCFEILSILRNLLCNTQLVYRLVDGGISVFHLTKHNHNDQ